MDSYNNQLSHYSLLVIRFINFLKILILKILGSLQAYQTWNIYFKENNVQTMAIVPYF